MEESCRTLESGEREINLSEIVKMCERNDVNMPIFYIQFRISEHRCAIVRRRVSRSKYLRYPRKSPTTLAVCKREESSVPIQQKFATRADSREWQILRAANARWQTKWSESAMRSDIPAMRGITRYGRTTRLNLHFQTFRFRPFVRLNGRFRRRAARSRPVILSLRKLCLTSARGEAR